MICFSKKIPNIFLQLFQFIYFLKVKSMILMQVLKFFYIVENFDQIFTCLQILNKVKKILILFSS